MKGQSILITGGCGFIGTNLIQELSQNGFSTLTVVDREIRPRMDWSSLPADLKFAKLDIRSPELLRLLAERQVSTVIHLAALHYIPYCDRHPEETLAVNVEGTEAVLAACAAHQVERFFMASTAAVYKSSLAPQREDDPLEPMDVYGRSKLANEQRVRTAAQAGGCRFAIGRIFNAVGAFETNPHLIPELAKRVLASNQIEIGNVESRRDYIHVRDICSGIIRMTFGLDSKVDTCNIGSGIAYSVTEVVDLLSRITNRPIELKPAEHLKRRVDRPLLVADNAKLREHYGWKPRCTFEQALREALEFARESSKGVQVFK